MPTRWLTANLCLACLLAWSAPGRADRPQTDGVQLAKKPTAARLVDQGVGLYYDGRYQKALEVLGKALRSGSLDQARRLGALQYQAICQVALGELGGARATFEQILTLNPDFRLAAGTAPKIINIFEELKASRAPPAPLPQPALQHEPPDSLVPGKAIELEAFGQDLPTDSQVVLRYRTDPAAGYSRQGMSPQPDGRYTASLPAPLGKPPTGLSYYFYATNSQGQHLAETGSEQEPYQVAFATAEVVPEEPDSGGTSIHWWIWPVVGAVLVGAGLAVGLTLASSGEDTGNAVVRFDLRD